MKQPKLWQQAQQALIERDSAVAHAVRLRAELENALTWVNIPMQASDAAGLRERIYAVLGVKS